MERWPRDRHAFGYLEWVHIEPSIHERIASSKLVRTFNGTLRAQSFWVLLDSLIILHWKTWDSHSKVYQSVAY